MMEGENGLRFYVAQLFNCWAVLHISWLWTNLIELLGLSLLRGSFLSRFFVLSDSLIPLPNHLSYILSKLC